MTTQHVPGDKDHPEWWTPRDEEILRGALKELAELPRPPYIERAHDRLQYQPIAVQPTAPRAIIGWAVFGAWIAAAILLLLWLPERDSPASCTGDAAACVDFATPATAPTTYGPPITVGLEAQP